MERSSYDESVVNQSLKSVPLKSTWVHDLFHKQKQAVSYNNHSLNDYTVLSSKMPAQLTSDSPPGFLNAWPRILYIVIEASPYSWAMSWYSSSKGLPTISCSNYVGRECSTRHAKQCHTYKAFGKCSGACPVYTQCYHSPSWLCWSSVILQHLN
jgi:hypothetical protein